MPYDNPYNRAIAKEVALINQKYVSHSDMTGQGTVDYTQSANISGEGFAGGANPNSMMGAGTTGGVAEYKKGSASKNYEGCERCDMEGGAILGIQEGTILSPKKRGRKSKAPKNVEQSFGTLGAPPGVSASRDIVAASAIPAANAVTGLSQKSYNVEGGSGFASGTQMDTGVGQTKGAVGKGRKKKVIEGAGLISGLNIPVISNIAGMFGLGKGEKLFVAKMKKKREAGKELTAKESERVKKMGDEGKLEGGFLQFLLPAAKILGPMLAGPIMDKVLGKGMAGGIAGAPQGTIIKSIGTAEAKPEPMSPELAAKLREAAFRKAKGEKPKPNKETKPMPPESLIMQFMPRDKRARTDEEKKADREKAIELARKQMNKKVGGFIPKNVAEGIMTLGVAPMARGIAKGILGRAKKVKGGATTVKSTPKMEQTKPVPKAQMPSSTMSGFGKGGKGKRAEIVKKVMAEKGLSMIEASKYVKANNLY